MLAFLLYTNHIQPQDMVSAENGDLNQRCESTHCTCWYFSLEASVDLNPCVIPNHHRGLIG